MTLFPGARFLPINGATTNTIYPTGKNSVHRELENERAVPREKRGEGTKNLPIKNCEQSLSSYQRIKFAEHHAPIKGKRDF